MLIILKLGQLELELYSTNCILNIPILYPLLQDKFNPWYDCTRYAFDCLVYIVTHYFGGDAMVCGWRSEDDYRSWCWPSTLWNQTQIVLFGREPASHLSGSIFDGLIEQTFISH